MVRRDADWKRHDRQIFDWSIVLIGGLIGAVSLYQWWHGSPQHATLAFGVTAWIAIYFTNYWQPVLYLVAVFGLLSVTLAWLWRGTWDQPLNQTVIVLNALFILLGVYLFLHEEAIAKRRTTGRQ